MKRIALFFTSLAISACSTNYYNPNIRNTADLERQRIIDEGYCTQVSSGSAPMPNIRVYNNPVNANFSGTVNTVYSNGIRSSSNYNGTISTYQNPGESFSNGLANGISAGAALRARFDQDKIFKGCMLKLGWTLDSKDDLTGKTELENKIYLANKNNDPELQSQIAMDYVQGVNVEKDIDKAIYWLNKSSSEGNGDASLGLYLIYAGAFGGNYKNDSSMQLYLNKAIEQGNSEADRQMGRLYFEGRYKNKNNEKAADYFKRSCQKNNPLGCVDMAGLYLAGSGVNRSVTAAYVLLNKAYRLGYKDALNMRYKTEEYMTKDEIKKVENVVDIIY